jgi:hypothetical protein
MWVVAAGLGACSGGAGDLSEPLPEPLIDKEKPLIELSGKEQTGLCNWIVSQFGGYGAQPSCDDGPAIQLAGSQAECVANLPTASTCTATVGDEFECIYLLKEDPCFETLQVSEECAAIRACAF